MQLNLRLLGAVLPTYIHLTLAQFNGDSPSNLGKRVPILMPGAISQLDQIGPMRVRDSIPVEDRKQAVSNSDQTLQQFYALQRTGSPSKRSLIPRQAATCPVGDYPCSDGISCCPTDTNCMVAGDGTPGCCPKGHVCNGVGGCKSGFFECPSGGCCQTGYTCSGVYCQAPGGSNSNNGGGNNGGGNNGGGDNGGGTCDPGYFACLQSQGGGCCKNGWTCVGTSQCQPPSSTSGGGCSSGKFQCPQSEGGGCCPTGSTCSASLCIKPCPTGSYRCSNGSGCCKNGYSCGSDGSCTLSSGGSGSSAGADNFTLSNSATPSLSSPSYTSPTSSSNFLYQPTATSSTTSRKIVPTIVAATTAATNGGGSSGGSIRHGVDFYLFTVIGGVIGYLLI